jgi:hypothetical protein
MALYQAIQAFNAADAAWQSALVAQWGKYASLARYKEAGHGAEGTPLRAAYERREAARRVYVEAWQVHFCQ